MRNVGPLLVLVGVVPFAVLAPWVTTDNSIEALLAGGDPAAEAYHRFQRELGSDEPIVVRLSGQDPITVLARAAAIEERLATTPSVKRTLGPRSSYPDEVALLIDPVLGGAAALDGQRPVFAGPLGRALHLFDPEEKTAVIYAFVEAPTDRQREALATALDGIRAASSDVELAIAGPPLLNRALDRAGRDVGRIALPVLAIAQLLMMLLTTRSLRATGCLFFAVGLAVLATDGAMVIFGEPTNIIVDIVKPLLLVLLLSSGVYVVESYFEARRSMPAKDAARYAQRHLAEPSLLSLLTTLVGFGSLLVSEIHPIRVFGVVSAFGLFLGAPLILVLLPALLAWLVPTAPKSGGPGLERFAILAVRFARRQRALSIGVGLVLTGLGPWALGFLRAEPHALHYFSKDHPLRRDAESLEAGGIGLSTIELVITSSRSIPSDRRALEALDGLGRDLEGSPGVQGVLGLPVFLREAGVRASGVDRLPSPPMVEAILAERGEALRFVLGQDGKKARLSILIETLDADQIDRLGEIARSAFTARFEGRAELMITGSYQLLLGAQRDLLRTLHGSLLSSVILMGLILLLAVRSLVLGLIALVPNVFPVSLLFLLMAALDLPLDLGTSMCAAIALGIAVDNTIHYIDTWKSVGLEEAARVTGRPVIITTLVVSAGFLSLMISDFAPTRNFGLLMTLAMTTALTADLFQLPALLSLLEPARYGSRSSRARTDLDARS